MTRELQSSTVARPDDLVVIGASTGGIQALCHLLPALPADFAPAVAIVMHVPPDAPARLAELFSPRCRLPVWQAEDKMPLRAGSVVFAPSGYHTLIEPDGSVAMSTEAPEHFSRPAIDALFESAAWSYRKRVLGILLTGANADGARGLAVIHGAGGTAWIQNPAEATAGEMPRSALARGVPAAVLDLADMAARLGRMTARNARARWPVLMDTGTEKD